MIFPSKKIGLFVLRRIQCGGYMYEKHFIDQFGKLWITRAYTKITHKSWRVTKDGEYVFGFNTKRAALAYIKKENLKHGESVKKDKAQSGQFAFT